jgi:drug/metabolite transporter (DMT)-like permease
MATAIPYSAEAILYMVLYSAASSSLLLINKLCLFYVHAPSFISTMQFITAGITPIVLMATNVIPKDEWEGYKLKAYSYYIGMFVCTIYCNMKALEFSNVETIIVFRACVPLVVSLLEWGFMGRQLPSLRSWAALGVLVAGAAVYVATDRAFAMKGWQAYTWVTAYFFIISVEMAYGKHIVGPHLKFASMWGPTMYTNVVSIPPMAIIGLASGEVDKLQVGTRDTAVPPTYI